MGSLKDVKGNKFLSRQICGSGSANTGNEEISRLEARVLSRKSEWEGRDGVMTGHSHTIACFGIHPNGAAVQCAVMAGELRVQSPGEIYHGGISLSCRFEKLSIKARAR